jgi:hypothetical protein
MGNAPKTPPNVSPPLYNTGMMKETKMNNTNTIPSWDEIFTNLAQEIASYDATLALLNELNN